METPSSLYVHIPFCREICAYCDFPKVIYDKQWVKPYLDSLFLEISSYGGSKYKTIYVGGGTPTSLEDEDFKTLLSFLSPLLDKGGEFSCEANPESLSREKARLMKEAGVNRVSIGMQTCSKRLLSLLGRKHAYEEVKKAVNALREVGIYNINVDWMYALPQESDEEFEEDAKAILALDVPHISAYSLILEEGTLFKSKGIEEEPEDRQAELYERILKLLRNAGYHRYEVSNFAKKGHECAHNIVYWKDERYVGCGLGAAGYIANTRYKNSRNLKSYIEGNWLSEKEEVGPEDDMEYFLITNLRLEEGFALDAFQSRFGKDFLSAKKGYYESLVAKGLLLIEGGRVKPSEKGMLLLDSILRDLI